MPPPLRLDSCKGCLRYVPVAYPNKAVADDLAQSFPAAVHRTIEKINRSLACRFQHQQEVRAVLKVAAVLKPACCCCSITYKEFHQVEYPRKEPIPHITTQKIIAVFCRCCQPPTSKIAALLPTTSRVLFKGEKIQVVKSTKNY